MIITKIRIQEEHPMTRGALSWPLPFCDLYLDDSAGENGYLFKAATGLGPSKSIAIVEGFDSNGVPIMGNSSEKREISLRVELTPDMGQSYSSLRDDIYKFLSRSVLVSFMDESTTVAQCSGFVREVDPVHFSNKPEVIVTIECVDGELVSPKTTSVPVATLNTLQPIVSYEDGTAPTGIELKFNVGASTASFAITNHAQIWYIGSTPVANNFQVTYPLVIGDQITVSTAAKDKKVTLLRSSVSYDLSGYVNAGAVWPKLYSGVNVFDWTFASSWMTWTSFKYTPRFWGV